jgi:hypothetical protein
MAEQITRLRLSCGIQARRVQCCGDAVSLHDTEDSSTAMALSAPTFQLFDDICSALEPTRHFVASATTCALAGVATCGSTPIASSPWRVVCTCHHHHRVCRRSWSQRMAQAMKELRRHCIACAMTSSYPVPMVSSMITYEPTPYANRTRSNSSTLTACYNHWTFRPRCGLT